jgi:hypothetical protein
MKVLSSKKYEYIGTCGIYHLFRCTIQHNSKEIVCVEEARLLKEDGSSVFYNTIPVKELKYEMEAFAV